MTEIPFLHDFVILFGAALGVIALSHRLRLPAVVGFLLTGMAVGPSGLGWIADVHRIEVFAELGVVFLLFGIGLELSTARLLQLRRFVLVGGGLQVGLTVAAVVAVAVALGSAPRNALYYGTVVALSSTAIVLKLYTERRSLEAPHGRVATGILLFQDFLIVPFLLLVPVLSGAAAPGDGNAGLRFLGALAVVVAAFFVARAVLPFFLRWVIGTRIRELFVIGALFACLGGASITESLGLSPVLGAFLAGVLIADSDYGHQALAEVGPFRDVFNSMFFISVGMLVGLRFAAQNALTIATLGAGIVVLKAAVILIVARVLGFPWRTRILAALGLAQIGELSFVLVRSGHAWAILDDTQYQLVIATIVLTMLLTPALIAVAPRLAVGRKAASRGTTEGPDENALHDHVVIVGFGLNGRHLARVLRPTRTPYIVVELSGTTVKDAKAAGEPILYGDITRPEIQHRCAMERAQVAIFAISDADALRRGVRLARQLNPQLYLIVRSRQLTELDELRACGADMVVAEEFETSIEIVTAVLKRLHVPGNVVRSEARVLRADGYQMLRSPTTSGLSDRLVEALTAGATETFLLSASHVAVGRSLAQIGLRERSGASVIAVVRNDRPIRNPAADLALEAGDVLVLVGSHAEVDAAFRQLEVRKSSAT